MRLPDLIDDELYARSARSFESAGKYGTAVVRDITKTLAPRSGVTCEPGNNSAACQKPTDNNGQTLAIVLGAIIPISCAIIVFIYLHRRNNKKQRVEDARDPHKSLDFGLDMNDVPPTAKRKGGKRGQPEMDTMGLGPDPRYPISKKSRGLSMDMLGSPYLLPAGLQGSHESLQSMPRSIVDPHDPYRPVTFMRASTETSRSPRPFRENGSMYSASTIPTGLGLSEKTGLVANAQRMSQSIVPARSNSRPRADTKTSNELPTYAVYSPKPQSRQASVTSLEPKPTHSVDGQGSPLTFFTPQDSNAEEPAFPFPAVPLPTAQAHPLRKASASAASTARKPVPNPGPQISVDRPTSDSSYYGEDIPPPPPPKVVSPEENEYDIDPSLIHTGRFSIDTPTPSQEYPVQSNRLSMMGLRPLPPDHPEENPEQRANRIRSFYKEYFDDSRPQPAGAVYEEDWDASYYGMDAAVYDPETGDFYSAPQAPYHQPMGRRAMTPPPRGAAGPRFASGDYHNRHKSTMSAHRSRGRQPLPKKNLPPPKALVGLPTPHLLRDDSFAIHGAMDFAPPTSFREMQNGRRSDSPLGLQRPYSPSVRAYSPLVSAHSTLSAIPSPHSLRKSGTFTSLDFARVPRLRPDGGTESDAGSIRSARSGISAMQMDAVRAGAYRVSRIPKEYVTSREDLGAQLRPTMNLTRPG